MSWVAVAVGTTAAVGAGLSYKSAGDQRKALSGVSQEPYYLDPMFTDTQEKLNTLGGNLLEGNVPEYFQPIGQIGGQQFEDMLDLTNRDIMTSAEEALAKSGRARGGALPAVTAKAVSDSSIKARFDNYLQAIEGRKYLLGEGVDILSGVRSAAMGESNAKNQYNQNSYENTLENTLFQNKLKTQQTDALSDLIGSIGGAATSRLGKINTTTTDTWNQEFLDKYFSAV